ncbi:Protein BIC1 [Vitis vinifera]|uniref:Protein BIC1 n=1 Tax=Vitis vinifera TaxID=29760 RepID=A0A438EK62_VITVI|nr:Protein BIC1 [Vitis vinifera]
MMMMMRFGGTNNQRKRRKEEEAKEEDKEAAATRLNYPFLLSWLKKKPTQWIDRLRVNTPTIQLVCQLHQSARSQAPPALRGSMGDVSKEPIKTEALASSEDSGRERLKRHRVEVAGSVGIPDMWGQEELMKDWVDCSVFDASLVTSRIMSARAALVAEGRRPSPSGLRIENRLLRIELWLASKLICLCAPVGALLNQSGK